MISEILDSLPYVLHFDNFTDRVPAQIVFPKNYIDNEYNPDTDKKRNELHSYIEKIFMHSTQNTLKAFLLTEDANDRV